MLRNSFVLILGLALGAAQSARADRILEQVESSFELTLASTTLPPGGVGDVSFKTCEKCDLQSRLLTSSTRFFLSRQEVPAAAFVKAATDTRQRESIGGGKARSLLMLYVDRKTLHVTRVALVPPTR